jgi:SH3-like domain-containing protein
MHTKSKQITFFLTFLLFTLFIIAPVNAEMASINGDKVQLRSGPGTQYKAKWQYGDGFPLKIIDKKGQWVKIKDFENDTGWIYKKFITNTGYMIVKANKNKKKKINIRKEPSIESEVVGQAYYGVVFKTLEQNKGWAKVKHESGLTGWINRSLLWGF